MTPPKPHTPTDAAQSIGDSAAASRLDSLIEYPSLFPIKALGIQTEHFAQTVLGVCRRFDPGLDESRVELRPSSAGHYVGVTVTVTATSREQLDGLYRALSSHPAVKVVL